ncbi:MAG: hypothetical protein PVI23_04750 [Maricaulaceae bacterium]|jgi:predicted metal-dependent HD superfamily phosphohydrolase
MLDSVEQAAPAVAVDLCWDRLREALRAPPGAVAAWRRRVARAYATPWRAYHTLAHVAFLAAEIERHAAEIGEPARLIAAALFHDYVYRSWRKDNEARSADIASDALADLGAPGEFIPRVHRLILWTAGHEAPLEADREDQLFLDMDLAVLGAPVEIYDLYATRVRREFFWAPPHRYRAGRRAFLKTMLARPRVFNTDVYEFERGGQARENITRELATLSR